jgi:hypothetical protein
MRDSAIYAEIYSSQLQSDCDLMPELCEEDLEPAGWSSDPGAGEPVVLSEEVAR